MISEPVLRVYCDGIDCDEFEEFGLTATARGGYDERGLKGEVETAGWLWVDENTHYCPQCYLRMEQI